MLTVKRANDKSMISSTVTEAEAKGLEHNSYSLPLNKYI